MSSRHYNIPVFLPELACPFQCVYCDQRKITGQRQLLDDKDILKTIELHLSSIGKKGRVQLAFFGGTFTGLSIDEQKHYLQLVQPWLEKGQIESIRISTRPDYIDRENLKLLKSYGVRNIELGAQSLVDEVLKQSRRGHSVEDVKRASDMIREEGFELGLQMMIGLPGDKPDYTLETAQKIVDFGASETRIYPTVVIRGTSLEKLWQTGKYKALDTETAIAQSAFLYRFFEENNIRILRVGLYPSEQLSQEGDAVAGPEMQHFKEKVISRIWQEIFATSLDLQKKSSRLEISVSPSEYNFAVGFRASNRKLLEQYFPHVKFKMASHIKGRDYEVLYR